MSATINKNIHRLSGTDLKIQEDTLAVEEPLEIRVSFFKNSQRTEKSISITMRTPGNDEELVLGFLFTEGIIENFSQVDKIHSPGENIIVVTLSDNIDFEINKLERHFYTTSSCGVCGKSSIDTLKTTRRNSIHKIDFKFNSEIIYQLPSILRNRQSLFDQTGGIHASALFDQQGKIILLREDVGRHNALDKLIGAALKQNLVPLNNYILLLSGRASFELIQKAYMANLQIVAAVGAPSSLAVDLAKENNITLIGFLKESKFNIYSNPENIQY